jgi:predicted tellurium resistance membrane protein TerC
MANYKVAIVLEVLLLLIILGQIGVLLFNMDYHNSNQIIQALTYLFLASQIIIVITLLDTLREKEKEGKKEVKSK